MGLCRIVGKGSREGVTFTESAEISSHFLDLPFPLLICKASIILVGCKFSAFKFQDCKFPANLPKREKSLLPEGCYTLKLPGWREAAVVVDAGDHWTEANF